MMAANMLGTPGNIVTFLVVISGWLAPLQSARADDFRPMRMQTAYSRERRKLKQRKRLRASARPLAESQPGCLRRLPYLITCH